MIVDIKIGEIHLAVKGKYTRGEDEVGLKSHFEIEDINTPYFPVDLSSVIEWAGAQGNHALEGIELTCLEKIEAK